MRSRELAARAARVLADRERRQEMRARALLYPAGRLVVRPIHPDRTRKATP